MITLDLGQAYLALPNSPQGGGVLLLHAWWGLTDYFKTLADRLAAEGFVVLAPDLYNGATATTIEEADHLSQTLDMNTVIAQIDEAIDYLAVQPTVSSDGLGLVSFSMGVFFGLQVAHEQPDAISALVIFYGTNPRDLSQMRAAVQGHFAETDDYEPREGVEQLEQSLKSMGLETDFFIYPGTGHWFFEADRSAYRAESARLAWERTVSFLHEKLDSPA